MIQNRLTLSCGDECTKESPKEMEMESVAHHHRWDIRIIPYTVTFGPEYCKQNL